MSRSCSCLFVVASVLAAACNSHRSAAPTAGTPGGGNSVTSAVFPGVHWEHADPESAGFSSAGLQVAREYLERLPTTGVMVVAHGRVILEDGNVEELSYIASARKSVLAMLFGNYVAQGRIRLDRSMAELGIDDVGGLSTAEKQATVADLLATRSGVYHPAASSGGQEKNFPPRGSQKHGTYFVYNNWDFNVLGAIFEKASGKSVYDALRDDLAAPIGMEDFRRDAQKADEEPAKSIYPAYHMWLSTRDMARVGYLMLREGNWAGQQLIPRDWVRQMTTITTPLEEIHPEYERRGGLAYGKLWWVFDDATTRAGGPLQGAYTAWGAFGQYITVIPKLDLVIANKSLPPADRKDQSEIMDYLRFVDLIVAAHGSGSRPNAPPREVVLGHHAPSEEGTLKSARGSRTMIRFENRSAETLSLYWIDRAGQRRSYGQLAPGSSRPRETSANDAWLVADRLGKAVTLVVAQPDDGVAIITDADLAGR